MMSLSSAYFDYNSAANGVAMEASDILVLPARIISEWQLKAVHGMTEVPAEVVVKIRSVIREE